MDSSANDLTAEAKLALVAERLNQIQGTWTLADGPILDGPGTTAVTIGADHTGHRNHLDLNFILNTDRPDETTISDCVTGLADDPAEAIRQAVHMWSQTTAAAVFELLTQRGQFADHYRGTEPGGFPGWHMIVGGIIGWGLGDDPTVLQQWLVGNLPWATLAPVITGGLDRDHFNGIKFFIAAQEGYEIAEVRINGRLHEPSTEALLGMDWPRPAKMTAARTFVLLVHRDGST